jgi:membrane-bound metal-dependent hydrolase YbcI (DUF457 family)
MAAVFIHYFLGIGVAHICGYSGYEVFIIGSFGALQDVDAISFLFYRRITQFRGSELLMHRGITHTLFFTAITTGIVMGFHGMLAWIIMINFLLHIFIDYVTAWGVSPFQPFSARRFSLELMTIYDVALTGFSLLIALSGFVNGPVQWAFAGFFAYIGGRFLLKVQLPYGNLLVPVGNVTYTYTYTSCIDPDIYMVGKIDILGRNMQMSVPQTDSGIDNVTKDMIASRIESTILSHVLEYPVYSREGDIIIIRDVRHVLFPKSSRFRFKIFYDEKMNTLYTEIAGKRMIL